MPRLWFNEWISSMPFNIGWLGARSRMSLREQPTFGLNSDPQPQIAINSKRHELRTTQNRSKYLFVNDKNRTLTHTGLQKYGMLYGTGRYHIRKIIKIFQGLYG